MSAGAVLVDLDGTLVDTAPDLVSVLNRLLAENGRRMMPFALARNEVSNGAVGLIRLGFGDRLPADQHEALRARFLELYSDVVCVNSRVFLGLNTVLDLVSNLPWGVVTNKPHLMTMPILKRLGLAERCGCIVSGDQLPQKKPHPAPLLHAADVLGVEAHRCVYVGDAPRDIEAGRAAGMTTVAAAYGYIRPGENLEQWGADLIVRHPADLAAALRLALHRADDAA